MYYTVMPGKKYLPRIALFVLLIAKSFVVMSQNNPAADSARLKLDSIIRRMNIPRTGIQPYEKVITPEFTTWRGLFTIHEHRDTIYFEIPDSILHRDIEVINRLVRGPGGSGVYSGEVLDEKTVQFERHAEDSTIRIRYDLIISQADSTSDIYKAVSKSNENPIVIFFPIKAYNKDTTSFVIDVTRYLKDGISFFNSMDASSLGQTVDAKKDISIGYIHAYPINVEMDIMRNGVNKGIKGLSPGFPVTIESHTSFIELPEHPMQQRIADPRVGYFADQVYNFGDHQQKVEDRKFILRWRLEPADEDLEKWKRGELVEPKKPIIIYIDPATPKQWRKYLIQGINDWQKSFEKAGFKHAIMGREWPEYNTLMKMDDARYSFINYLPSETWNAYGPQVHDPRSGEIIQTHIGWYHNVLQLLHEWYIVQAGATDPRARHAEFDEELMGQLIRFVSSHEVGHTLGLRHNFGSSSQTPVDSLRSKNYLDLHGHTASIMDYARFNYVAQPEDRIPEYDLFPRIGEYDTWAIEWGYKNSFARTSEEDKKITRQWIVDSTGKNPRLWFGNGEVENPIDPRCQREDLGDDAIKASSYGIMNLKRILPNLPEWTHEDGGIYENLSLTYQMLKNQYFTYMNHVLRNIGGVYYTRLAEEKDTLSSTGQKKIYEVVPIGKQQAALDFFDKELFTTPYWLLDKTVTQRVQEPVQPDFVEDLQIRVLNSLLDINRINKLMANMRQFGNLALPADEYLNQFHKIIWKELASAKAIDPYRRNLQKSYVGALQDILTSNNSATTETDAHSIIRHDFVLLQTEVHAAIAKQTDALSKYHLQDLEVQIRNILEAKRTIQ
jgi:hypothetical protein